MASEQEVVVSGPIVLSWHQSRTGQELAEFAAASLSLDFVRAAALPMAGMTALEALDTAALAKGAVLLRS